MTILHLQPQLNLSCGITKTIYLLMRNLDNDFDSYCFCSGGNAIEKFTDSNLNVIVSETRSINQLYFIKVFLQLFSIIKQKKIKIVHSHHRTFDFMAYILSFIFSIKTITSVQSKVSGKNKISYNADILIACSEVIKNHLVDYFKIREDRIIIIHNFVDLEDIHETSLDSTINTMINQTKNKTVIGFIGRMSIREKGVDILLHSFNAISERHKDLILLMISDGEDNEYVDDYICNAKLDAVRLSSKRNVYSYLSLMDIVAIPSRIEPFGIVAIEAGALKKCVIASRVDGLMEIIEDEKNGFLFRSENVDDLNVRLLTIINNYDMRFKLGNELFTKVVEKFSSDKIVPKYRTLYLNLINGKS